MDKENEQNKIDQKLNLCMKRHSEGAYVIGEIRRDLNDQFYFFITPAGKMALDISEIESEKYKAEK
jgi:hypothetical protein